MTYDQGEASFLLVSLLTCHPDWSSWRVLSENLQINFAISVGREPP